MANPLSVLSPTLSSASSYVTVTSGSGQSDDEVVYSVDDFSSDDGSYLGSDGDFVVLDRPLSRPTSQSGLSDSHDGRAHTPNLTSLASDFQSLTLEEPGSHPKPKPKAKHKKKKKVVVGDAKGKKKVSGTASSSAAPAPSKPATKKRKKRKGAASQPTSTVTPDKPISFSSDPNATQETVYEEAVGYITSYVPLSRLEDDAQFVPKPYSFIANPEAKEHSACRLTLLQALIIELGLATPSLPRSLTAARNFLKSHVFINIREYLDVRGQGLKALQDIMYPSRKSLIKAIRAKKNTAPLALVKESGLQILLVRAYHV